MMDYTIDLTQDGEIDSAPDEKQDEGTIQPVGALDDSLDVKQGEETDEPCGKVGSGPDQKQEDQPIQVARRTDPGGEQSDEAAQPDGKIDQSGAVESNSIHVKEKWKVTLSSPKSPRLEKIIWNTSLPVHPETTDGKTNPGGEEDDVADHPDREMDELESAVTQFELTSSQIKEKWKVTLSSPRLSWSGEIILNTSSPVHHETTKNTKQCEHITPNVTPKVKSPIQNQDVQTSSNLTCASKEKGSPKAVPPCMVVKNSEQHDLLTLQSNLLIPMPDGTMRRLKVIQMKNMSNKPLATEGLPTVQLVTVPKQQQILGKPGQASDKRIEECKQTIKQSEEKSKPGPASDKTIKVHKQTGEQSGEKSKSEPTSVKGMKVLTETTKQSEEISISGPASDKGMKVLEQTMKQSKGKCGPTNKQIMKQSKEKSGSFSQFGTQNGLTGTVTPVTVNSPSVNESSLGGLGDKSAKNVVSSVPLDITLQTPGMLTKKALSPFNSLRPSDAYMRQ